MVAQIVVVERPRGGLLGRLRGARAWLRAAWQGDALGRGRRVAVRRTRPLDRGRSGDGERAAPESGPEGSAGVPTASASLAEASLAETFAASGAILDRSGDGMLRLEIQECEAAGVLRRLREEPTLGFGRLIDLTVVDRIDRTGRLEIVYVCEASERGERLRIHVPLEPGAEEIESAIVHWPAAAWLEREAFDLFGVRFRGHPGLQRLLLPADFEGAPLRRDFVAPTMPDVDAPR